jgi:hypothetical protein
LAAFATWQKYVAALTSQGDGSGLKDAGISMKEAKFFRTNARNPQSKYFVGFLSVPHKYLISCPATFCEAEDHFHAHIRWADEG